MHGGLLRTVILALRSKNSFSFIYNSLFFFSENDDLREKTERTKINDDLLSKIVVYFEQATGIEPALSA